MTQNKSSATERKMTESEILDNLEFVTDRLLELKEWDSSKKIQQIKNYIVQQSLAEEQSISFQEEEADSYNCQMHTFLMAAG
jgi:ribosomal protein L1